MSRRIPASSRLAAPARTALAVAAVAALQAAPVQAQGQSAEHRPVDLVVRSQKNDVSPPLRELPLIAPSTQRRGRPVREHRIPFDDGPELDADPLGALPGVRRAAGGGGAIAPAAATTVGVGVDGVGNGFNGPAGTMSVNSAPPDTTGAVGGTQFVQWVNTAFAVFDKATMAPVYGPANGVTLWSGFGGACEANNDGDPVVQWDKLAGRWVVSQFAVPGGTAGYWQCVAVSQTADATGRWNRYAFQYTNFNDFPKMGVWPDAYYVSYNMFSGNTYAGSTVCAMDRAAMLAGNPATQQCISLASSYGAALPADLDGPAPAAGTPNLVVARGTNSVNVWKMKVDWANSANTRLSGPVNVPVAAFSAACGGGNCITQPGTQNKLDSLADRLNFRAAYRADRDSLVLTHAVSTGSKRSALAAVRWYELRNLSAATPTLAQQGTIGNGADGVHRWMGSIAQDKAGNIAVAYSASGGSVYPSMRVSSRSATDPLGTMATETVLKAGSGSQTGTLTRWGDYSQVSLDADDCTFYATNEYMKTSGSFNWNTWISSFKLPGCP